MTAGADTFLVLAPTLGALALVDSLSLGTLAIPAWLLAAPGRLRTSRVILYLGTVAAFYIAIGVLLLLGARAVLQTGIIDVETPGFRALLFGIGLALLILSFVVEPVNGRRQRSGWQATRLSRWRGRALGVSEADTRGPGAGSIVTLAFIASGLELFTMLPYLGALGLISGSSLTVPQQIGTLLGYCVVMILPALLLLLLRMVLGNQLMPLLTWLDRWFVKHGTSTMAWILGIVGVILMIHNLRFVQEVFPALSPILESISTF